MYVLRRDSDGRYVAKSGSEHSYTWRLEEADVFSTREAAATAKCGNEYVVDVRNIMNAGITHLK